MARLLLDTHVLVRWRYNPSRLSREQVRVLQSAVRRAEPVAFSAITLLELAVLTTERKLSLTVPLHELFDELQCDPVFHLLPLTFEIASEVVALRALRDPSDRVIVATARVHHLQLVTSDQRIIDSKLVPVVE